MNTEHFLDLRGLKCPMPMLRTKKALATLKSGAEITVWATDDGAPDDFAAFCQHTGHTLVSSQTRDDGVFVLTVRRK